MNRVWLLLVLSFAAVTVRAANSSGAVLEVGSKITAPNGNTYDQFLLTGSEATIEAEPGRISRISFLDINDDIVQVEFSGRGRLAVTLIGGASPPVPAAKYNQPGVLYVRGLASLTVTGSDASTNIGAYSVGKTTTQRGGLVRDDVAYDGIADLALLTIVADPSNPGGSAFGGIRMANVAFSARSGDTGIYAPSVQMLDLVRIGDIAAFDAAIPKLWFGSASQFGMVTVAGGDLQQPNARPIQCHYFTVGFTGLIPNTTAGPTGTQPLVAMQAGETSAGVTLPAQPLRGTLVASITGADSRAEADDSALIVRYLQAYQYPSPGDPIRITEQRLPIAVGMWNLCVPPESVHGPHYKPAIHLYANGMAHGTRRQLGAATVYPIGSMFVKEKFDTPDALAPSVITVMEKVGTRGFPEWQFTMIALPERKIIRDGFQLSCVECHARNTTTDFVSSTTTAQLDAWIAAHPLP